MRKKYILLLMTLLATTIQTGCNQKAEKIVDTETNQILESPSPISDNENVEAVNTNESDNNIDEAFKEKWVNATRFIQQELSRVPGANEKISKDETDAQFDKLVDELYDTLIIDLRWNPGGNRYLLQSSLIENKEYLSKKHIRIITGSWTASAGVQAIEDCLALFDDVIIYGEPTRGAIHNYTEIKNINVPKSRIEIVYTYSKRHLTRTRK